MLVLGVLCITLVVSFNQFTYRISNMSLVNVRSEMLEMSVYIFLCNSLYIVVDLQL